MTLELQEKIKKVDRTYAKKLILQELMYYVNLLEQIEKAMFFRDFTLSAKSNTDVYSFAITTSDAMPILRSLRESAQYNINELEKLLMSL